MNTHADKTQENKSESVYAAKSQMQNGTFQFVDNRPEAVAQRKRQAMANNSPQARQAAQLKAMANSNSAQQQNPIQKQTISEQSPKLQSGSTNPSNQITQLGKIKWMGHLLWDTDWDEAKKRATIKVTSESVRGTILRKMLEGEKAAFQALCEEIPFSDTEEVPDKDLTPGLPAKKDPSTTVNKLQINYVTNPGGVKSDKQHGFLEFFAQQAADIGFDLEVLTTESGKALCEPVLASHRGLKYTIKVHKLAPSEWAEDSVEFLDGESRAVLRKFKDHHLTMGIDKGRKERWGQTDFERNKEAGPAGVPDGFKVNMGNTGQIIEETSEIAGHIRSYIEGGNMIVTETNKGVPVILIGKDSIAATMEAYQVSREQVLGIMSDDFGVHPKQIVPVEQPGKFHLDMGLMAIGKGLVIVNKSEVREDALKPKLEAQAAKDLAEAGFTVIQKKLEDGENFNFFNGEYVTGRDGEKYYLTNGGPEEQQREFRAFMIRTAGVKDVRFAPLSISRESLREQGGVGCRAKGCTVGKSDSDKEKGGERAEESIAEVVEPTVEMDSTALAGRVSPGTELRFEYLNNSIDCIGRVLTVAQARDTNVADQLGPLQVEGDEATAICLETVFKRDDGSSRETVRAPHVVVGAVRMLDHTTSEEIIGGQGDVYGKGYIPNVVGNIFTLTERDIIQ